MDSNKTIAQIEMKSMASTLRRTGPSSFAYAQAVMAATAIAVVFLSSCNSRPKLLLGTWKLEQDQTTVSMTLHSDGTLVGNVQTKGFFQLVDSGGNFTGVWSIKDGRFTGSMHTSTTELVDSDHSWSDEILEISTTTLRLKNLAGEIEEYERIK